MQPKLTQRIIKISQLAALRCQLYAVWHWSQNKLCRTGWWWAGASPSLCWARRSKCLPEFTSLPHNLNLAQKASKQNSTIKLSVLLHANDGGVGVFIWCLLYHNVTDFDIL